MNTGTNFHSFVVQASFDAPGSEGSQQQTITIPHEVLSGGSHATTNNTTCVLRLMGFAAPVGIYGTLEHTLSTQRPSELVVGGEISGRKIMATLSSDAIHGSSLIVPTGRDLELQMVIVEEHSTAFSALMTFSAT